MRSVPTNALTSVVNFEYERIRVPLRALRQQRLDYLRRLDARQPLVEALVPIREPLMIEAERLQHGRVEVVDVYWILDDVVREVVGLAVDGPRT